MEPYSPGKPISEVKRELGLETVVKLASNENPLRPSPLPVAALKRAYYTTHPVTRCDITFISGSHHCYLGEPRPRRRPAAAL